MASKNELRRKGNDLMPYVERSYTAKTKDDVRKWVTNVRRTVAISGQGRHALDQIERRIASPREVAEHMRTVLNEIH